MKKRPYTRPEAETHKPDMAQSLLQAGSLSTVTVTGIASTGLDEGETPNDILHLNDTPENILNMAW